MFNKLQIGTKPADVLAKARLTGPAAVVLVKFMYSINRYNIISGGPKDIAENSGMTVRDFNVGIRDLKKADVVRKYTKKEYMLNPDVMFNGDEKQYYIIRHMWETQTSKGLRE